MKNCCKKLFAHKKTMGALIGLGIVIVVTGAITVMGISRNMEKAAQPEPTVTWFPDYPAITASANSDEIKRGEYLVKAGDCIACHTNTATHGAVFAGGRKMQTPFGVLYTPNITPDHETGIGGWTEAQFEKAMREGISPQGHYYYPAFPFLYFSRMPSEDIKAIKAYLDNIPAVHQENRENEMVFPFNIRLLQLPWRLMFFHPQQKDIFPTTPKTAQERGAYLVEGSGHCAMCHTPSWHIVTPLLPLGAPQKEYHLTGMKVQGYLAPNISASNLGKVSDAEITAVFSNDKLIGGGKVAGPMLEVNHDSLRYLTPDDQKAIAIYLKSVHSKEPPRPSGANAGKGIYEAYCSGCHMAGAGGAPKYGDAAAWSPYLKKGVPSLYTNAIKGINGMPAMGTCMSCTDKEIQETVDYMIAPVQGVSTAAAPPPPKKLTMTDAKKLYAENCSVCHESGFKGAPKPGDVQAFKPAVDAGFEATYLNVMEGRHDHPIHGACPTCSDAEIIAALKYMMQQSAPGKDYSLW